MKMKIPSFFQIRCNLLESTVQISRPSDTIYRVYEIEILFRDIHIGFHRRADKISHVTVLTQIPFSIFKLFMRKINTPIILQHFYLHDTSENDRCHSKSQAFSFPKHRRTSAIHPQLQSVRHMQEAQSCQTTDQRMYSSNTYLFLIFHLYSFLFSPCIVKF